MEKLSPYRVVAKEALMSWNEMSEEEATKAVMTLTHDELESQVYATGSITYAVEAVSRCLGLTKSQTEAFKEVVLGQDSPNITSDQARILSEVKAKVTPNVNVYALQLYSLKNIHDHWVTDNAKKFEKPGREQKKYQHLPLQMIGWKEAKADLLFLAPVLDSIGISVDEVALHLVYDKKVKEFYERNGFVTPDGQILTEKVAEAVMKGKEFYPPLTEVNTAKTKEEAIEVAKQSEEKTTTYSRSLK